MTRVIQWGTGAVGEHALRFVLGSRDLELVGAKCHTVAKEGQDAGELVGFAHAGVALTRDADKLLATAADVVLFMPRDTFLDPTVPGSPAVEWVDDVVRILESGKNVISPLQSAMHWRQLARGEELRTRLSEACTRGNASLYFTGLDPGFVSDCLAITLSSAAGEIRQIRTLEVIDYATYPSPDTLASLGYGKDPAELSSAGDDAYVPSWGGALWLVADALGVELDDTAVTSESRVSPYDFTSPGGTHVAAGTIGALRWSISGIVNGVRLIECIHVSRMRGDLAPDWPQIGERGGYRVEIDGTPPLRADLPLGLEGGTGTCLGDAVMMTAARCVNAISAVHAAEPGYLLFNDLPTVGGRHTVTRGAAGTAVAKS